ncbi:hypothetical protein Pyrde_1051 [Pyrodictium delaneyi]|uniref:Uncharacterized protein n=1 Tax=Pyrodictium delaneyi TaxID=1273541 RepID=A0A0P0N3W9_9CREN|nr:hypothetical protein [Pyrodictium delaneyi]ALL01099.1 hypothetical protein Pyrde_1051 [Pyrodictium delaneyi]OWJ55320.1 hypothetical protein Pdsh_00395 [Pyrodictium delaneyi]
MAKPVKLILVTADHHPQHKLWLQLVDEVAKETGLSKEVRIEDYVLLTEYGDTDDLGMPWLPQLLVQLDDNSVKVLISRLPLDKNLKPDVEEAKQIVMSKLNEITN